MSSTLDSKGRVVIPKEERDGWMIDEGNSVQIRITNANGDSQPVRDEIDSRGRVMVPKRTRNVLDIKHGDRVDIDVLGVESGGYVCDDCDGEFDLAKILIVDGGDRVVCADCSKPEDRIID